MQEIQVISHCLTNPSVRLKGLKPRPLPVLSGNIIQLPCPEAAYFGLNRWEVTREQLDMPNYRRFCRRIFQITADIIQLLYRQGHEIKLIGTAGSPSCGAKTTSSGFKGGILREADHIHQPGTGVFFEEIIKELDQRGIGFNIDEI